METWVLSQRICWWCGQEGLCEWIASPPPLPVPLEASSLLGKTTHTRYHFLPLPHQDHLFWAIVDLCGDNPTASVLYSNSLSKPCSSNRLSLQAGKQPPHSDTGTGCNVSTGRLVRQVRSRSWHRHTNSPHLERRVVLTVIQLPCWGNLARLRPRFCHQSGSNSLHPGPWDLWQQLEVAVGGVFGGFHISPFVLHITDVSFNVLLASLWETKTGLFSSLGFI